jgi:hypothetical protein
MNLAVFEVIVFSFVLLVGWVDGKKGVIYYAKDVL